MSAPTPRALAAVIAASCTVGLLALTFRSSGSSPAAPRPAARPVAAQNVIVIPRSDQVSNPGDASVCPWLKADSVDGHPMSADAASSYSPLLATPLAAAVYATSGMRGVARLYGC